MLFSISRFHRLLLVLSCLPLTLVGGGRLQADAPFVSYIFPAGGQRGTNVAFRVGGHYLHESCPFEMLGDGVTASERLTRAERTRWFEGPVIPMPDSQRKEDYPKAQQGTVKISADAALGVRRWRVWTSQGATESMKFVVGDLPEIVEQEIDGQPIPTAVQIPVTINGRIFPREDIDIWTFEGQAGKSYTCEVNAARLGSALDSRLEVIGPDGKQLAENIDAFGADSFLQFVAPADGIYQVRIHDINFGGLQHYVYRLTIDDAPYIDSVFPLGGKRGETVEFELLEANGQSRLVSATLPSDRGEECQHRFHIEGRNSNPVKLRLSDCDESMESEPNDERQTSRAVAIPAVANGRIDRPNDVDCWRVAVSKGAKYSVDLIAARLGSPLDSVVTVTDENGKVIVESDDVGKGQTDSRCDFEAREDGEYVISVRDRFVDRGGPRFGYRLEISESKPAEPDFALQIAADAATVLQGAESKLKISVERMGGFEEEIELVVDDLPSGVTVSGTTIGKKKNDATLVFKAAETAEIGVRRVTIGGQAKIGEDKVTRLATAHKDTRDDQAIEHLLLAVALPTPFKVVGEFETKYAAQGSTYLRRYSIERGGFDGPITISLADRQVRHLQGVTGQQLVVPAGVSEFEYPIKLAPWMEVGRTSRTCVMAVATVTDHDGREHKVSYTSQEQADQIIVLVDPGQLQMVARPQAILAKPGGKRVIEVEAARGPQLQSPVLLELVVPEHIRGVRSSAVELSPSQKKAELVIEFAEVAVGPFNMPLTIRGTTTVAGFPWTAECQLEIVE